MDLDDIDSVLSDYAQRQLIRFLPSHHGAPLTYYPQRHVMAILSGSTTIKKTPMLLGISQGVIEFNKREGGGLIVTDDPSDLYYFLLSKIQDTDTFGHAVDHIDGRLEMIIQSVLADTALELSAIADSHPALKAEMANPFTDYVSISQTVVPLVRQIFYYRELLGKIRSKIQHDHINGLHGMEVVLNTGGMKVCHIREVIIIRLLSKPENVVLINHDQLLMLYDTLSCRFMTKITLSINDHLSLDNLPSLEIMRKIYSWGDELIHDFGMNAYAVIGEFESVVTSIFVSFRDSDPLKLGAQFLSSVIETFSEIEDTYHVPVNRSSSLIEMLVEVESVNWLSEIFGVRKHWGNPMVVAADSGRAVQEKINEQLPVSGSALRKLLASFNRMITLEYIKQHGEWPKCSFGDQGENTPLGRAHAANSTRIPETHREHDHLHWSLLQFQPNATFDSYENDLTLISDKSVSLYRQHLDAAYVRGLVQVPIPSSIPENRRLILEYIRTQHMSIMDIFKVVMCNTIPEDWLANSAAMKGTEMKHIKARIFAVLTYEIRQYFAATEDIIKSCLFRYNPHQTMTLSESELLSRLRAVTRQLDPDAESRWLSVIHIVDFSKWNLRMRYTNTSSVFKSMDDFLGTPGLIEMSHIIFADMVNMVQDPFNPPAEGVLNTESDTIWRNHLCGWEGQRQKGWTLLTSAVLSNLERETGVHSTICGQGDNQTLLTKFPIPNNFKSAKDWIARDPINVRAVLDSFYNRLDLECQAIGLKIKTAETCRSLCYFNYGKRLYFSGVELSMTLKRISKNITEPNDSYPTTESLLKTLEGSAFAAGLYSHPSVLPYIMGRFSVALQLYESYNNNQLVNDAGARLLADNQLSFDRRFLSILMKIPPCLGGPPQQPLSAYLFRGHPDPGCTEVVMLTLRARAGCETSRKIIDLATSGKWFNSKPTDRSSLIMSPYSLNLTIPLSARVPMEKEILPALKVSCHNKLVKEMFSYNVDSMSEELIQSLSTMEPFQPLVANDIYSRSIPGRRQTFLSGLANTTSLGRLLYETSTNPMIFRIQKLEVKQLTYWVNTVKDILECHCTSVFWQDSHHNILQTWRDQSWGVQVVGVTVPHPLEQFSIVRTNADVCNSVCQHYEPEHIVLVRHSEDLTNIPGADSSHITTIRSRKGNPYLGSTVSEGIIQKQIQCLNPDETWRDIIRINTVRRWVTKDDHKLDALLKLIVRSRTDVDQNLIDAATGHPSRTAYNHRASLMGTIQTTNVASTTNMHSRLYISSNRMGRYSHGEYNYHMPFGSTFLCYQELVCWLGVMGKEDWAACPRANYHIHVRSQDIPTVFEGLVETKLVKTTALVSSSVRSPILYSSFKRLQFVTPSGLSLESVWDDYSYASIRIAKFAYCYQLIGDVFVKETNAHEYLTISRRVDFTHRSIPISIGDVKLVGVKMLIQAISWQILLLGPTSIWFQHTIHTFHVRAMQFINSFSPGFWAHFSLPMSNIRIADRLLFRYSGFQSPFVTKTTSGLHETLKIAVVLEMWSCHSHMIKAMSSDTATSPVDIYASTIPSLKLLWSKYMEYCVFTALATTGHTLRTCIEYSRDFSSSILSTEEHQFPSVLGVANMDFYLLCEHLKIFNRWLPYVKFWSLHHPWVDKLRWNMQTMSEDEEFEVSEIHMPLDYPNSRDKLEYFIGSNPVRLSILQCDCELTERSQCLHTECYFALSGNLSKSHLRFLDIIYSNQWDIHTVICLGSSTGSEAHAFASHQECCHVYVNCYLPMTSFSPHLAGNYIPAAFVGSPLQSKLINPSSAAVAHSDVSSPMIRQVISDHIKDHLPTGLTCDIEMASDSSVETMAAIVTNIMGICIDHASIKWIIVKLIICCEHVVQKMIGVVSQVFGRIQIISSPFSRPGMPSYFLCGDFRISVAFGLTHTVDEVPVSVLERSDLSQFLEAICKRQISPMFSYPRSYMLSRLEPLKTAPNSYQIACHKYIPGWNIEVCSSVDRLDVIQQLKDINSTIDTAVKDATGTFYRTHMAEAMPRNTVLQVDMSPLHSQLNRMFVIKCRSELLLHLLTDEILDIRHVYDQVMNWLSKRHSFPLKTRPFKVDLDVTGFINYYSRFLFEILGHIYKNKFTKPRTVNVPYVYHRHPAFEPSVMDHPLLSPLPLTARKPHVNMTWSWRRRSEILFWMMASYILMTDITLYSPNSHHLDEFHIKGKLGTVNRMTSNSQLINCAYIESAKEYSEISFLSADELIICIPYTFCDQLFKELNIKGVYKCPWSGIVPNRVILHCVGRKTEAAETSLVYPMFGVISGKAVTTHTKSLFCSCWDCVVEDTLLDAFSLTHSEIDKSCSLTKIETVHDHNHIL